MEKCNQEYLDSIRNITNRQIHKIKMLLFKNLKIYCAKHWPKLGKLSKFNDFYKL
jgi:hypothetical protein